MELAGHSRTEAASSRSASAAFTSPLAVVEGACHLQRVDVVAQRRELLLLQAADSARGVQQHHVDAATAPEGARHRTAGVAGGRDQHHDTLSVGARAELSLQQRRQERGAEVLEGAGRAVEELQQGDAVVQPAQRRGERKGVLDQGLHRGRRPGRRRCQLLREEPGRDGCGHLPERSPVRQGGDLRPQVRDRIRLIEAASRRQSGQQRGAERQPHAGVTGGTDLHPRPLRSPPRSVFVQHARTGRTDLRHVADGPQAG